MFFISKTFSPAEWNYEIYDRELLAIIRTLSEWCHYIQGSAHTTVVHSNHKNLTYFRNAQKLNRRQAWWSLNLSEFDLQMIHVPGKKMIVSDALSQWTDHFSGNECDNEDITLLPDHLFANAIDSEPILHILIDTELQEKIANAKNLDTSAAEALKLLLEDGPNTLQDDLSDWTTEDLNGKPMLFYQGKQYVPKNDQLQQEIVNAFHYPITAGHLGEIATYNDIAQYYWWPGLRSFVKNFVKGCTICQQFKINWNPTKPSLMPIPGPNLMGSYHFYNNRLAIARNQLCWLTRISLTMIVTGLSAIVIIIISWLLLDSCRRFSVYFSVAIVILDHMIVIDFHFLLGKKKLKNLNKSDKS